MSSEDLVIVANRLPVESVRDENGNRVWRRSPGGLVSALEPVMRGGNASWIGWNGSYPDLVGSDQLPPIPVTDEDRDYSIYEVPLNRSEVDLYYDGFSNSALWPLYHDAIVTPTYHRHQFDAYRKINMRFAEAASEHAAPGSIVWVQDYQLQLVPAMLRSLRPDLKIGFFLHIPFPAPDLFMNLPWRREIILGLLGADVVGFQTAGGARNFLDVTERLLGLPSIGNKVEVPGQNGTRRTCLADAFGISVDSKGWAEKAESPEIDERVKQLRADLGNPKTVLLGVDRLDYTKGIDIRLKAYTELLHQGLLDPTETVLVQVATPSRENVDEYQRIRDDVEMIVSRTNGDLGQIGAPAIHYVRHSLPIEELISLYKAADIMLVTPLRDGMNLVSKEYIVCRTDNDGALVLSEFTGAANDLPQSWLVNPYDADGVKSAIIAAAHAPKEERMRRMKTMRAHVMNNDVQKWARTFLDVLRQQDSGQQDSDNSESELDQLQTG